MRNYITYYKYVFARLILKLYRYPLAHKIRYPKLRVSPTMKYLKYS